MHFKTMNRFSSLPISFKNPISFTNKFTNKLKLSNFSIFLRNKRKEETLKLLYKNKLSSTFKWNSSNLLIELVE